jgi:protein gp37
MSANSAIKWTDHTYNPWWGCTRVSPGCQHCYAETFAKRTGNKVWGQNAERRFFGDKHWAEPLKWDRAAEKAGRPALVFCASMADVFEDRDDVVPHRDRLFELVESTPHLIWQLLTKRPENVLAMVPAAWLAGPTGSVIHRNLGSADVPNMRVDFVDGRDAGWPSNVWVGTTVEDQQRADERIPHLRRIPAPVRFLSCEPLLGPVDLSRWLHLEQVRQPGDEWAFVRGPGFHPALVEWVIAGGESGPGHRPMDLDHARSLRDQCTAAGVPFFFKQHGGQHPTSGGHLLDDDEVLQAFPAAAGDRTATAVEVR